MPVLCRSGRMDGGIQVYMKRHKYGNTETYDLWNAWSQVSGRDISEVRDAVPVIFRGCCCDGYLHFFRQARSQFEPRLKDWHRCGSDLPGSFHSVSPRTSDDRPRRFLVFVFVLFPLVKRHACVGVCLIWSTRRASGMTWRRGRIASDDACVGCFPWLH